MEIEIRALSLVRDSNRATTDVGADPSTQDDSEDSDSEDSDQTYTETRRQTHYLHLWRHPILSQLHPARDEEEEEQLILERMEVRVETEEDTLVPCRPAETSSTTDYYIHGIPPGLLILQNEAVRSNAPPALHRLCCSVQKRSVAARQIGAPVTGQHRHRSKAAQGHSYDSQKQRGAFRTAVGGDVVSDHRDGANHRSYAAIDWIGT
uniref:uncharacterized protein n=1 Tax=Pristiophorus japonicus TaxID=55135 RepID=UPI00398EDC23